MQQIVSLPGWNVITGLSAVLLAVLFLPFLVKKVEYNLEVFLFIMGAAALTISGLWGNEIIKTALVSPVSPKHPIVEAVLLAGFLFALLENKIDYYADKLEKLLGLKLFVFLLVLLLGILSSVITAIIAALVLAEIITALKLDKATEIKIVVFSCFSIGLGAALTPVGEPLATILISRLKGEPYYADFFFLIRHMSFLILPAVVLSALAAAYFSGRGEKPGAGLLEDKKESYRDIFIRGAKVYLFIMGLEFLAKGFSPIVDYALPLVKPQALYWINMISAILDNATLTAAEATPGLTIIQIKAMLMGLLISGGILIPGNIPNIIAAGKLKISSKDWARTGLPFGIFLLVVYYVVLFVL
jgi:predicted cation transporter